MLQGKKIRDFVPGEKDVEVNGLSSVNSLSSITFSAVDTQSCMSNGAEPSLDRFWFKSQPGAVSKIMTPFVVCPTITGLSSFTVYSTIAKSIVV